MAAYWIGYTLNDDGQKYSALHDAIRALGGYWNHTTSSWIVSAQKLNAEEIRDALKKYVEGNDTLIVVKLTGEAAWYGVNEEGKRWLLDYL